MLTHWWRLANAEPGRMVAVLRMISPLVIGIEQRRDVPGLDVPAILHHTRDIVVVDNGEMVDITPDRWRYRGHLAGVRRCIATPSTSRGRRTSRTRRICAFHAQRDPRTTSVAH